MKKKKCGVKKMKKSLVAIMLTLVFVLLQVMPCFSVVANAAEKNDTFDIVTSIKILTDNNGDGTWSENEPDIDKSSNVRLEYTYLIPELGAISTGDTFTIAIPLEVKILADILDVEIRTPDGVNLVMTADIFDTNILELTFEDYVSTRTFDIVGDFTLNLSFNSEEIGYDDTTNISFDVGQVGTPIVVPVTFDQPDVTATVSKQGAYSEADNEITWTITANTNGPTVNAMSFSDTLTAGHEFVTDSVLANGVIDTTNYAYDVGTREFTYTFPTAVSGQQEIKFKTSVLDSDLLAEATPEHTITNDVDMTVDGETTSPPEADVDIPINLISKSGVADDTNRLINWTITANESMLAISDADITDTLPTGLTLFVDGTHPVTIDGSNAGLGSNAGEYAESGQDLTFHLGTISDEVEITFATRVADSYYDTQLNTDDEFTNPAELVSPDVAYNNTVTSGPVPINTEVILKNDTAYDPSTGEISWEIIVNPYSVTLTDVVITDDFAVDQEYVTASFSIVDSNGDDPYVEDSGNFTDLATDFTFTDVADVDEATALKSGDINYAFPVQITEKYTIAFKTLLSDPAKYMTNYSGRQYNTADVLFGATPVGSDIDNRNITSEVIDKSSASDAYHYNDRIMTWNIQVNQNSMDLDGVVITDDIDVNHAYVDGSFTIENESSEDPYAVGSTPQFSTLLADDLVYSDVATALKSGDLTYTFPESIDQEYNITYQTELTNLALLEENTTLTFSNTSKLVHDDLLAGVSDIANRDVDSSVVEKEAAYANGTDYIDWTVTVNANEINLTKPVITDIFEYGLKLATPTIELYAATISAVDGSATATGAKIPLTSENVSYDEDSRTFIFTFPYDTITTAYQLKYTTDVVDQDASPFGNTASMVSGAITQDSVHTGTDVEFQHAGGSASGLVGSITIKKMRDRVDKDNPADPDVMLAGAEFELIDLYDISYGPVTTDANGEAKFDCIRFGVPYTIKEVSPPTGYLSTNLDHTFTILSSDNDIPYELENTIIRGTITFTKLDNYSIAVAGAVFGLYAATDTTFANQLATATSGQDGTVTFLDVLCSFFNNAHHLCFSH
jgi:fimbrial isopeptide formation D2 family protein